MIEGKGLGGKKVNRVNVSLSNHFDTKLRRLATACNMRHTTLAGLLIEKALDSTECVAELQKEYCIQSAYKVLVVQDYQTGQTQYVLNNTERNDFR